MREQSSCEITVDLHGMTVEEALRRLNNPLFSSRIRSIRVVHGRGSGALKNAVREHLKKCKMVREIIYGEDMNIAGRDGVTLVYK
ncbi:MAG: Smr/MutS family protein [Victivallaceae bacterium]|nr:Smr/MutS family protein [Victivallaceae bacterium]MDD4180498.1 Smr/MutS family protein [Victivallaceae bacterium]